MIGKYPGSKSLDVAREYLDRALQLPEESRDYRNAVGQVVHILEVCEGTKDPLQLHWIEMAKSGGMKEQL